MNTTSSYCTIIKRQSPELWAFVQYSIELVPLPLSPLSVTAEAAPALLIQVLSYLLVRGMFCYQNTQLHSAPHCFPASGYTYPLGECCSARDQPAEQQILTSLLVQGLLTYLALGAPGRT